MIRTKNKGTKKIARMVALIIPPITPVPMATRLPAQPADTATTATDAAAAIWGAPGPGVMPDGLSQAHQTQRYLAELDGLIERSQAAGLSVLEVLAVSALSALYAQLGLIVMVVCVITGRVVPMFTKNVTPGLVIQAAPKLERAVLVATALALLQSREGTPDPIVLAGKVKAVDAIIQPFLQLTKPSLADVEQTALKIRALYSENREKGE